MLSNGAPDDIDEAVESLHVQKGQAEEKPSEDNNYNNLFANK